MLVKFNKSLAGLKHKIHVITTNELRAVWHNRKLNGIYVINRRSRNTPVRSLAHHDSMTNRILCILFKESNNKKNTEPLASEKISDNKVSFLASDP